MLKTTSQHGPLASIFELCKQVNPYLQGNYQPQNSTQHQDEHWLLGRKQDSDTIHALYYALQQTTPDAGSAYWMTRSWDLLCWQPIYIAFISIYGLQQLPDFTAFKQHYQHSSIFGFAFHSEQLATGSIESLITLAALQLRPLLEHYRQQLDALARCRPGYVKRLLSDLILDCLLKVRDNIDAFNDQDLLRHAQLWINAFALPDNLQHTLIVRELLPITHTRTSCCLTYKANNEVCDNCPKKTKLKPNKNKNDNL